MNDIDDKILAAMRAETEESLEEFQQELGLFGLIGESFKGALGWVVILAILLMVVFAGVVIYCGIEFYHASDIALKLNWFAGGLVAFIIFAILRLWFFMELNRHSIKREIKRVELQVSLISNKIDAMIGH